MWSQPVDKNKPKGKTRFFESVKDPLTGSYKTFSVTMDKYTTQTIKTASRVLEERRRVFLSERQTATSTELTFGQLVRLFNTTRKADPDIRASTQKQAMMKLRPVERLIGTETPIKDLSAGFIKRSLLKSGEDAVRLNGYLKILKVILRWGYANDYITDISYLAKVQRWKEETPYHKRIEDHYMEKEELEKLIDGMADRKYKLLARFLVLSGLRIGEMIALEKSDVDIDGRVIHVTKNRQAVTQETGLPKNSTSYRDVYMQDELASVCAEINQLIEMLGIKSKLFFPNNDGGYLRHDAISKYFRENSERILGRRVTPHMLRHTHVSLVVEASVLAGTPISLDDIAERLGHANSKITKEIYYHKTNLVREAVNRKFDSLRIL